MTIPMPLHQHEIGQALEIARHLAGVGVPVFAAEPCYGPKCNAGCRRRTKGLGVDTGFHLPPKWERTAADPCAVDAWRTGWALCAVGGVVADALDADPRHGGLITQESLYAAGMWPISYGRQATPSGGFHDLIAPLGVGSANPIGAKTDAQLDGIDLRGGRPDGEGRGFIFIAPTVRPSKTDGVPRPYRWLSVPDVAALVAQGPSDRSGARLAAIAATPKAPKHNPDTPATDADDFFGRGGTFTPDRANQRIRMRLDSVTNHARWGWDGFRDTVRDASFEIGGFVGADHLSYEEAQQALTQAIINASTTERPVWPDHKDLLWIQQGLDNGAERSWTVKAPPPLPPSADVDSSKKKKPKRLPLVPDKVWERRSWLKAIRDRAHEIAAVPDATLGAALSIFASSVPHNIKVRTGIQYDLGLSLLVGTVSGSGLGKSSGWKLARREFAPVDAPRAMPTPSGEGLIEELMGYKETIDPMTAKPVREHVQMKNNALFTVSEGAAMSVAMERNGSLLGPVLRSLFSDEELGTTNASEDRKRYIPPGNYSIGVVVLYQETTAMKIINDTDTGTAQRFLWFSGHSPSAPPSGLMQAHRMSTPRGDGLPVEMGADGQPVHILSVEPAITEKLRAEDAAKRNAYSLGDINRDSQKPAVVAKVAALACLIEGRSLVTMDDWDLAEELYAASRAVQDELLELAEEQDRDRRREQAAKAGEADHVRKSYRTEVCKVAATITRKVAKLKRPITRREITQSVTAKKRPYIAEALEFALLESGWLAEDGEKYVLGPTPIE